jgi:hypothetical protein
MKPQHALTMVPVALGLLSGAMHSSSSAPTSSARSVRARTTSTTGGAAPLEFSIPVSTLNDWSRTVITDLDDVSIEGHSAVHPLKSDCEMHLGAHSSEFSGDPDGLVLEPMNACILAPPDGFKSWPAFGDDLVDHTVKAFGVPRIWPEHLENAEGASNPLHAAELHPLTSLIFNSRTFDFSANVFAGDYTGGLSKATALKIAQQLSVSVTRNANTADVSFSVGGTRIGNFTVLTLKIDGSSIADDGAGSLAANAEIVVDDSTSVPVHLVSPKGSKGSDELTKIKSGKKASVTEDMLVLYSLSPQALLDAANKSSGGDAIDVDEPIQLIVYGLPGVSGT